MNQKDLIFEQCPGIALKSFFKFRNSKILTTVSFRPKGKRLSFESISLGTVSTSVLIDTF